MKGQNFRLFLNNSQRIVGALSCNFDYDIQVEDDATKDTEGEWAHNAVVGKQLTITAEAALQLDAKQKEGTTTFGITPITVGGIEVWPDGEYKGAGSYELHKFNLHQGDVVSLRNVPQLVAIIDEDGNVLYEFSQGDAAFDVDNDYNGCYFALEDEGGQDVDYVIVDGGILFKSLSEGTELSFAFHPTEGDKNADIADVSLVGGRCVITKRTLRSTNRQRTVWSLTAVSNGEIYT